MLLVDVLARCCHVINIFRPDWLLKCVVGHYLLFVFHLNPLVQGCIGCLLLLDC